MHNLLTKLFGARAKEAPVSIGTTFTGFEHATDVSSLNSYKDSLYLYIAVSKIQKRLAGIPLELHRIKNRKGETEELFDHPILDLFYNPNELQTQRVFMETSAAHYLLAGDVFWYIDRTDKSMVTLRPDRMEIVLTKDGKQIVAYEYRSGNVTRFKPEDIVHVKNPDPTNVLRGVGVVRPANLRIITEKAAATYQANFFKNQGRPDMAVFVDGNVDDEKGEAARSKWQSIFGRGNGGKVAFFGDNTKSIQELNKTPKEMDFIQSQNFLRDDILAALGVPKAMVTSDDVNMANAKEAYKMFLQEAVVPVLEAFVDVMNNRLLPTYDQAIFFRFDDPTPNDREHMLKEHTAGVGKWITQNEARIETGREPIEGGDELGSVSFNGSREDVKEEAKQIIRRRPILAKTLKAKELTVDALMAASTEPKREMNSIFPTKAMKDGYAKAYNKRVDKKAETLKDAIDKFHEGQLERILATDLDPTGFMDVSREKSLAKDAFTPVVTQLFKDGGQAALDAIFRKSADTFFVDEVLLAAVASRVDFFTDSVVNTSFEVLKSKIVAGISAGDGVDKISLSIREYFTDMTKGRANTIARTETGFAISKATSDAYAQSSIVTGMEWISAGDAKVRPEHVENNGVIVAKGGAFPSGEHFPAEHSMNCRCVVGPTV